MYQHLHCRVSRGQERKGLKTYLKKTNTYDLIYMLNLINKIDGQNRNRGVDTWNRMTADRRKGRVGKGSDWMKEDEGIS